MAITTNAELLAAVASWLARDDLTTYIPDFVTLFEAKAARVLQVRPMETTATLTPSSGVAALPTGYLGHRRLTWQGSTPVELTHVHPSYLQGVSPEEGTPSFYTIEGGNIIVRPSSDTDLELVYYAKNTALASSLNWLFTNHPDAYLFGSLAEAHGFNIDANQMQMWGQRRDEIFEEIRNLNFREPSGLSVRVFGSTP